MANRYDETSQLLPTTVKNAIGQPPICDLEKVTGRGKLVAFIEFELVKLSKLISVGGNLNDAQVQFISTQLIELFPGESLADFKICFQRGAIGQYGEIFRMDGIVIRKWMEQYLDEKYTIVEEEMKKSPDSSMYKPQEVKTHDEKHSEHLANWLKSVGGTGHKVPGMTDEDTRKYGQEKPVRETITSGYKYFEVRGVQIYAITQEHAEELAAIMIKNKLLIQDGDVLRRSDIST
jgi:hypothetical protein